MIYVYGNGIIIIIIIIIIILIYILFTHFPRLHYTQRIRTLISYIIVQSYHTVRYCTHTHTHRDVIGYHSHLCLSYGYSYAMAQGNHRDVIGCRRHLFLTCSVPMSLPQGTIGMSQVLNSDIGCFIGVSQAPIGKSQENHRKIIGKSQAYSQVFDTSVILAANDGHNHIQTIVAISHNNEGHFTINPRVV